MSCECRSCTSRLAIAPRPKGSRGNLCSLSISSHLIYPTIPRWISHSPEDHTLTTVFSYLRQSWTLPQSHSPILRHPGPASALQPSYLPSSPSPRLRLSLNPLSRSHRHHLPRTPRHLPSLQLRHRQHRLSSLRPSHRHSRSRLRPSLVRRNRNPLSPSNRPRPRRQVLPHPRPARPLHPLLHPSRPAWKLLLREYNTGGILTSAKLLGLPQPPLALLLHPLSSNPLPLL